MTIWGSGKAEREFLYIDDAAAGCWELMESYDGVQTVNIGVGHTDSIADLAETVKAVVGYTGELCFDTSRPDGMLKRLLDTTTAEKYHIKSKTLLEEGLKETYQWYLKNAYVG